MGLVQILSDQTGCGKSNMAAFKPEEPISPLPGDIATNLQQLFMAMFWGRATRLDRCENGPNCGFVRSQRWRLSTVSRYLKKDKHFQSALNDTVTSKASALTAREPRVVVCATGSVSHTWPSYSHLTAARFNSAVFCSGHPSTEAD